MKREEAGLEVVRPSSTLWGAAVVGLLGVSGLSCSDSGEPGSVQDTPLVDEQDTAPAEPPEPMGILSTETLPELTFADFSDDCLGRGGVVQIHATCAGNNACRGMSFNKWSKQLTEHTCKGLNSCGGASCVVLPGDQGRTGAELYEESCGSMCHGDGFTVYVAPGTEHEAAMARFTARTPEAHVRIIAFGARGMTDAGTAYANMPGFHEKMSRAEIERLVAHLRTLEATPNTYGVPGETEDFTDVE
jgi:hypothetical protein